MQMAPMPSGSIITQSWTGGAKKIAAEQHRRDDRDGIGLEQVGGHAGAIADVVAHVVRDHGGVAGVVLGNARLDLADEVGADIGPLGEDAAAEPREDRDQGGPEAEAHHRLHHGPQLGARSQARAQDEIVGRDAQQPEPDDQETRDRARLERDRKPLRQAVARGLRGADVGAHRDVHADIARSGREHGPDQEADADAEAQHQSEQRRG